MVAIKRLGHVVLRVSDLKRSKEFYLKYFNFHVMEEDPRGVVFLGLDGHGNILDLLQTSDASVSSTHRDFRSTAGLGLQHFAFEFDSTADLKQAYLALKEGGARILEMLDHGSTASVYFSDPDGNIVEFCHHRPAGWELRRAGVEDQDETLKFD